MHKLLDGEILAFGFKVHNEDNDINCCDYFTWAMQMLGLVDICAHYFELIGFSLMPFRPTCVVSFKILISTFNFQHNKQLMLKEMLALTCNAQPRC
jgi:hypothetical protein